MANGPPMTAPRPCRISTLRTAKERFSGLAFSVDGAPRRPGLHIEAELVVVEHLDESLCADAYGFEDWGISGSGAILARRAPSSGDAGRVKAWRKRARDGTLPPVLLMFVTAFDMHLVLDGHDRLLVTRITRLSGAVSGSAS